jgi:uncharacterized lipoprotein YmbA
MMVCHGAVTILCALAAVATGCASTPPAHFYTLSATATPVTMSSTFSVAVGPLSVPAVVDRPEIVISTGAHEVQLDEFNHWASPLQDNLARVIAENLVALLGTPRVTLFPQTLSADADYRVAIEVQRFQSILGNSIALDAVWIVRRAKDGKAQTGRTSVRETVRDESYDALAAAHSQAVVRVSQEIAYTILALDASEPKLLQDNKTR